jgi:nicotinamidase-related amidase
VRRLARVPGGRAGVSHPALLVIDPQLDFLALVEAGSPQTCGPRDALAGMARLITAARSAGTPVVVTQELHRPGAVDFGRELDGDEPVHCVEGTPGAELLEALRPGPSEHLVRKRRYSAFFATDLDLLLRGLAVDAVVVCGLLSDVCVHYTCVDAHQLDLHVHVVPEACAGSSAGASLAAFAAVEYLQRGAILTLDGAVGRLAGSAALP